VNFVQPLLKGFGPVATRGELRARDRELEAARHRYEAATLDVSADVENAYWRLYASEHNLNAQRIQRQRAALFLRDAQLRGHAGVAGPGAVAAARTLLADQEALLLQSRLLARDASDELAQSIGISPSAHERIHCTEDPTPPPPLEPLDVVLRRAFAVNPGLHATEQDSAAARARWRAAEWNAWPTLEAFGSYGGAGLAGVSRPIIFGGDTLGTSSDTGFGSAWDQVWSNDFPAWTFGLRLVMPIGWRSDRGERDRQRGLYEQSQEALRARRLKLESDVRSAYREAESAGATLATMRELVAATREQARVASLEYQAGRTTAYDLVDIEAQVARGVARIAGAGRRGAFLHRAQTAHSTRTFEDPMSGASLLRRAAGALLLPLLALAAGCGRPAAGFKMPPVPVEVAEVQAEAVRDRFRAVGSIEADEIVKVVSELNAVARELPFLEGQSVKRGQLLAQLDDREIAAEAQRAEALRDQARTNLERVRQLHAQNAASSQELDDASAGFKVAEANLAVAEAQLSKTRIVSPLSGVAGRRQVSPGAFLRVGDSITEVASLDVVKVHFAAPERFVSQLRTGGHIDITSTAYPGETFHGQVRVVDPIVDEGTRTVQLVATVVNPGRKLRPGMSADVSATLSERPNALTVPDEALFAQGDQTFVFVVKADSTVARQAVLTGTRDSAKVEIAQGLTAGERIVRAGHQKLYDGAKVMPIPSATMAGAASGGASASGADQAPGTKK
jgi:membrane fusion protein (multidrug efflux system)